MCCFLYSVPTIAVYATRQLAVGGFAIALTHMLMSSEAGLEGAVGPADVIQRGSADRRRFALGMCGWSVSCVCENRTHLLRNEEKKPLGTAGLRCGPFSATILCGPSYRCETRTRWQLQRGSSWQERQWQGDHTYFRSWFVENIDCPRASPLWTTGPFFCLFLFLSFFIVFYPSVTFSLAPAKCGSFAVLALPLPHVSAVSLRGQSSAAPCDCAAMGCR